MCAGRAVVYPYPSQAQARLGRSERKTRGFNDSTRVVSSASRLLGPTFAWQTRGRHALDSAPARDSVRLAGRSLVNSDRAVRQIAAREAPRYAAPLNFYRRDATRRLFPMCQCQAFSSFRSSTEQTTLKLTKSLTRLYRNLFANRFRMKIVGYAANVA